MQRREFLKTLGAAGVAFSLLDIVPLRAAVTPAVGSYAPQGFSGPFDLDLDPAGNLQATHPADYRVLKYDSNLKPSGFFGSPGSEVGRLNFPKGLAVDPSAFVYVVDSNNGRVQVLSCKDFSAIDAPPAATTSSPVKAVIGSIGAIGGSFSTPQGIHATKDGQVMVADTRNHRIQIFKDLQLVAILGDLGDADDRFRLPTAVSVTPAGDIVVLDSKHAMVKMFGPDLKFKQGFGGNGSAPGKLNLPQGMKIGDNGHIWVADTGNHRIQEFSTDGKFISAVGKAGSGEGEFNNPTGLALRENQVYVADNGNSRIVVIEKQKG